MQRESAMSSGRRSHLMSGWRRTIPDAVHGASSKMRSNGSPSHHVRDIGRIRTHQPADKLQPIQGVLHAREPRGRTCR